MKDLFLKHLLINAIEHGGKADVQAVIGKIIAEKPEFKTKIGEIIGELKRTVSEVNSLSVQEQKQKLEGLGVEIKKEKVVEKQELPDLPGAKTGKVVTAFPPEPSKFPHMGHAKAALINFLYAKKYKGKFIIRFEDSNPELAKKEYYGAILNGLKWLGIKWNKLDHLSDHIPEYYKTIETLVKNNNAYVCLCPQEIIKSKRATGENCGHRGNSAKLNLELWKKMLKKFGEGEATVRLKIDMQNPNTVLRDPSIARINLNAHPRTKNKFRVWPMYDFGTAMLDAWEGVTHRVRSKEFELRAALQQHIHKVLGYPSPYITEIGRFNIKGVPTQGRIIRELIHTKKLLGWDDPRLTTLVALKRRGFVPEALREFLVSTGVTKTEAVLEWPALESFNRKIVDRIANRYFAVLDPIEMEIEKFPKIKNVRAQLHPDFKKRGFRKIPVNANKIYIEREDHERLENKNVGLINLATINVGQRSARFVSKGVRYEDPKIHWVSKSNVRLKIVMPTGKIKLAIGEPDLKKVKVDQIIQLVRVGFCRVDKTGKETVLYFTHK